VISLPRLGGLHYRYTWRQAVDSRLRMQCGVACRNAKNDYSEASNGSASTPCSNSTEPQAQIDIAITTRRIPLKDICY
jgi:hypothetical protein